MIVDVKEHILPKGTRVVLTSNSYYSKGTVLVASGALGVASGENRFYTLGNENMNYDYGDITIRQDNYKILHDKAPEEWL